MTSGRKLALWLGSAALFMPTLAAAAAPLCPGYSVCPEVDTFTLLQTSRDARQVQANVTANETAALNRLHNGVAGLEAERLLGKLIIYDRSLSVDRQEACASCHTQQAGFTGGITAINLENAAFPGATLERSSRRKPISYAYAPFAPILHYDAARKTFIGGNFWDMRATGTITGNPAGDQAMDPPITPVEMDLSDPACAIYRIAQGPYAGLFKQVWGAGSLDIGFPANTALLCAVPLSSNDMHPTIVPLTPADRALVGEDYKDFGRSSAAYEASPAVSAFSSKFDAFQNGQATLTPQETLGLQLFTGRANCSQCHAAAGKHPLFTDFSAENIGMPQNADLPYLHENVPDPLGYVANAKGPAFVDNGVGHFLLSPANTNEHWHDLAPKFFGTFQVPTLRNADRRPDGMFRRDYMHDGFMKSLPEVVHFYNTRDVLARCPSSDPEAPGVGVTCWPAPEQPANENTALVGNLGLSAAEEAAIVAFLGTLTDGYVPPPR